MIKVKFIKVGFGAVLDKRGINTEIQLFSKGAIIFITALAIL